MDVNYVILLLKVRRYFGIELRLISDSKTEPVSDYTKLIPINLRNLWDYHMKDVKLLLNIPNGMHILIVWC
jgi:hypothetical protein